MIAISLSRLQASSIIQSLVHFHTELSCEPPFISKIKVILFISIPHSCENDLFLPCNAYPFQYHCSYQFPSSSSPQSQFARLASPHSQTNLAFTYMVTTLQHFLHHLLPPLSTCREPSPLPSPPLTNHGIPNLRTQSSASSSYAASSSSRFGSGHAKHEKQASFRYRKGRTL